MEDYENSYDSDIDLANLDDDFDSAEVEDRDFESVPDGKYQVQIERVELTRAKSSGNPLLKWTLKIIGPSQQGRKLWRNNIIVSPENIKWLKQDLYTCGLQLAKLSELPTRLDELLDITLEVTKRTSGDYENVYLNQKIVMVDEPAANPDDELLF